MRTLLTDSIDLVLAAAVAGGVAFVFTRATLELWALYRDAR